MGREDSWCPVSPALQEFFAVYPTQKGPLGGGPVGTRNTPSSLRPRPHWSASSHSLVPHVPQASPRPPSHVWRILWGSDAGAVEIGLGVRRPGVFPSPAQARLCVGVCGCVGTLGCVRVPESPQSSSSSGCWCSPSRLMSACQRGDAQLLVMVPVTL